MTDDLSTRLKPVKFGVLLSLLTILYAFGLGTAFGGWEDDVKGYITAEAAAVKDDVYKGDEAKMKKITDKSWVYFKRAHKHAGGIGAAATALILVLSLLSVNKLLRIFTAVFLGLGGLGYSVFWMLAALKAPALGSTGAAKEALAWLAIPSAGLCLIGLVVVLIATAGLLIIPRTDADK